MAESIVQVKEVDGTLVVDSREIAAELDIRHKDFLSTLRKYQAEIEREFGAWLFETATDSSGRQNPNATVIFLTEEQAAYVMTLSRNTDAVRRCKRNLASEGFPTIDPWLRHEPDTTIVRSWRCRGRAASFYKCKSFKGSPLPTLRFAARACQVLKIPCSVLAKSEVSLNLME